MTHGAHSHDHDPRNDELLVDLKGDLMQKSRKAISIPGKRLHPAGRLLGGAGPS